MTRTDIFTKALKSIATKGGREVTEGGQIVEYDGHACAFIAKQALKAAGKQPDPQEGE